MAIKDSESDQTDQKILNPWQHSGPLWAAPAAAPVAQWFGF